MYLGAVLWARDSPSAIAHQTKCGPRSWRRPARSSRQCPGPPRRPCPLARRDVTLFQSRPKSSLGLLPTLWKNTISLCGTTLCTHTQFFAVYTHNFPMWDDEHHTYFLPSLLTRPRSPSWLCTSSTPPPSLVPPPSSCATSTPPPSLVPPPSSCATSLHTSTILYANIKSCYFPSFLCKSPVNPRRAT